MALHTKCEVQETRNDGSATDEREYRNHQSRAAATKQLKDDAPEHYWPRNMSAGRRCAARRKGIRLPTRATIAARPRTTGTRINRGDARVPKTLAPRMRASAAPKTKPIAPPAIASKSCSIR